MELKILSWNIWDKGDYGKAIEFLKNSQADVIGLQEIEGRDPAKELGYQGVFAGRVGILSKYPIVGNKTYTLLSDGHIALQADIDINGTIIHTFCVLLKAGEHPEQKENLLKMLPQEKVLLLGDFNVRSTSSLVKSVSQVLMNTGDETSTRGTEKIDYIFVTKDLKCHSSKVESSTASDHLPISTIIEI